MFGQAAGCLGSAVLCDGHALVPKPPAVTFTEAATIPTVFLTAYSCLHEEAAISTESCILVHAATGVTASQLPSPPSTRNVHMSQLSQ